MKMVGFEPGDLSERINFSASDTDILGKRKFRVLPTGVEPMTFRLVLLMLKRYFCEREKK